MTVAQIAKLLNDDNVNNNVISLLKNDSRISVLQLVAKWERRRAKFQLEQKRLYDLCEFERLFRGQGFELIAGVDEAGRGPLAGPVVIGAVILPADFRLPKLNDSKKLSSKQREELYYQIKEVAITTSVSVIDVAIIDEINIYQATIQGMYDAVNKLFPQPQAVLVDAVPLPGLNIHWSSIINGDALSASIAAASVIAKVERDRIMNCYDIEYPEYGFSRHKGYATAEHFAALVKYGPCDIHRRSFEPIKSWVKDNENKFSE